jgi:hypothetical protein
VIWSRPEYITVPLLSGLRKHKKLVHSHTAHLWLFSLLPAFVRLFLYNFLCNLYNTNFTVYNINLLCFKMFQIILTTSELSSSWKFRLTGEILWLSYVCVCCVKWQTVCVSCQVTDILCVMSSDKQFVCRVKWQTVCVSCQVTDSLCVVSSDWQFVSCQVTDSLCHVKWLTVSPFSVSCKQVNLIKKTISFSCF